MRAKSCTQEERRGTVLLIVVVIVMLLSLAAYKFMLSMQTEHLAAAMNGERLQATQAANSARELVSLMLELPRSQRDRMGGMQNNPRYFSGNVAALSAGATSNFAPNSLQSDGDLQRPPFGIIAYGLPTSDAFASKTSDTFSRSSPTSSAVMPPASTFGNASPAYRYGAINESSKLHLANVLQWEIASPGAGVAALLHLPGMDEATANALLDWIDVDDDPRDGGAESEFYTLLANPYAPRNGTPLDLEELLFVRGLDSQRLFGIRTPPPIVKVAQGPTPESGTSATSTPTSSSTTFPTTSAQSVGVRGDANFLHATDVQAKRPWSELLTIYSAERNETYTGQPRLFINANDLAELHAQLATVMPPEWATFIVLYRQFGTSTSLDIGSNSSAPAPQRLAEVTIDWQHPAANVIVCPLDLLQDVTVETESGVQTFASPLGQDATSISPEFLRVLDVLTDVPESRIVGRVNVNEAPAEVLLALPGMNETIVDAILSSRQNELLSQDMSPTTDVSTNDETQDVEPPSRSHPIWLLSEGIVDVPTMRTLWPHVTCGGDVFRAQIWGYVDERSPIVRMESVLDASQRRCHAVYARELDAPRNELPLPHSLPPQDAAYAQPSAPMSATLAP